MRKEVYNLLKYEIEELPAMIEYILNEPIPLISRKRWKRIIEIAEADMKVPTGTTEGQRIAFVAYQMGYISHK